MLKLFMKSKKGFTLVELMVVVIIIGILVAIAVPVYNNVSGSAASKANDANIRTIKGAVTAYRAGEDDDDAQPTIEQLISGGYLESSPQVPNGITEATDDGKYDLSYDASGKAVVVP